MIKQIEHHIVDHCNLNCAGCSHFSPLCEPWFENIEDFKQDFKKLANFTKGSIDRIRLLGGEPLLHPNIDQFLIECRRIFPKAVIELITNGILLKKRKKDIAQICHDCRIVIVLSNYGILNIEDALEDYTYSFYNNKVDSMYNICLDTSGKQDPTTAFNNCEQHILSCIYYQNGRFAPCSVMANINHFNKRFNSPIKVSNDDIWISIDGHSLEEVEQFLNNPISACKFCNTAKRDSTKHDYDISKGDISEWVIQ